MGVRTLCKRFMTNFNDADLRARVMLRRSSCSVCRSASSCSKPGSRARESVNILVEGIADTCICGVTFWLWGFAFMFEPGNGFIGTHGFFLKGLAETYGTTGVPLLAFWVFQFAFADTCSTITSGAMVGRCGFIGDILYSIGVTGFIYPIIGHWAWGPDGWLATMGPIAFHDFAGSTVVHSIGGAISLIGAIALGPRLGRVFRRDGGGPPLPHNIILGAVGGLILWFGWYGFNPQHFGVGAGIGRVSLNTRWRVRQARTPFMPMPGRRGTWPHHERSCPWCDHCPCYRVARPAPFSSARRLPSSGRRARDPTGACRSCGIWGTLSLGLFATGAYGLPTPTGVDTSVVVKGLFYGGGTGQLMAQAIGSGAVVFATLAVSVVLMYAVKATGTLRVSREGELEGLDLHEHGMTAYPEYVIHGYEPDSRITVSKSPVQPARWRRKPSR